MIRPRALSFRDKNLNVRVRVPYIGRGLNDTITYDYLITNDAEWTSTFALGAATLSGKTIAVAPGNYTSKTISSFNPAATVRVISASASSKPQIDRIAVSGSSKLSFESLQLNHSGWTDSGAGEGCLQFSGTVSDIALRRCDFRGNYRGTVDFTFDVTTDTIPEYACIRPIFNDLGVVTGFDRNRPHVGDLLADGTYSMVFGSYSSVTFTVHPVATFTVAGGEITGTTLTSGGASNGTSSTGSGIRTRLVTWTGQRRMFDWMPSAWRTSAGTTTGDIIFEDCDFRLCNSGLKPSNLADTAHVIIRRCTFDKIYQDYISLSNGCRVTIEDCFGTRPFSNQDAGDPHSDFVQLFYGGYTADWDNIAIERNIFITGTARGAMQGILLGDPTPGYYYDGIRLVGNAIINQLSTLGIDLETIRDGYVYRNLACRFDPADTVRNTGAVSLSISGAPSLGTPFFGDNIGETLSEATPGDGSVSLGLLGATLAYADVFSNHTGSRSSRAEVAAAYAPKVAHAGKGPFSDSSYINHAACTTNRSLEPTYCKFNAVVSQTASSVSTSNWSKVQGGVDGRSISVSGGEYRIADDTSGTNATAWTATASTVNVGKFVQVRLTNSGLGSTTTTATLTIGSNSFTFQSTTASAASFAVVDNQGTAYSATARPSNETSLRKALIAVRFRPDAITTNANILAHTAASALRLWFPTTSAIRFQFLGTSRCRLIPASFTPTVSSTRTHIFSLDFTNTSADQGAIWATDVDGVLSQSGSTFDTRSVAGSGVDYGSHVWDLTSVGGAFSNSGSYGLFAEADGGGIVFDGAMEFFWMDWGGSSYTLPDITDATVRNRWSADLIGANGQGPTGSTPKIYYTGSVAGWNAGLSNLGSLTLALTKGAGTYV